MGYERLRESVLENDRFEATRCGLGVFVSQGMAAWMKVYRLLDEPQRMPARETFVTTPSGLASEIAELLAELFIRREEVSRC